MTPQTEMNVSLGANWKDWYFQVKMNGYMDSDIVFKSQDFKDRYVHFELKPYVKLEPNTKVSPEAIYPVSHYTVSGSRATLTWEDHSSNELGFKIERKTESKGTYHEIATVGPNTTTYTDTGLSGGTTYYYRVRAYNADGQSPYSEEIRVKTSTR